mmetsp:Transcript_33709/g.66616  ORF Transcript_33709/g.66616 Transcript_33709/m.66616 type:complete len:323 (+) Transcript_33709:269-1237(+)
MSREKLAVLQRELEGRGGAAAAGGDGDAAPAEFEPRVARSLADALGLRAFNKTEIDRAFAAIDADGNDFLDEAKVQDLLESVYVATHGQQVAEHRRNFTGAGTGMTRAAFAEKIAALHQELEGGSEGAELAEVRTEADARRMAGCSAISVFPSSAIADLPGAEPLSPLPVRFPPNTWNPFQPPVPSQHSFRRNDFSKNMSARAASRYATPPHRPARLTANASPRTSPGPSPAIRNSRSARRTSRSPCGPVRTSRALTAASVVTAARPAGLPPAPPPHAPGRARCVDASRSRDDADVDDDVTALRLGAVSRDTRGAASSDDPP